MDEEGVVFLGIIFFGFNSETDEIHNGYVEEIML